jgi:hypothetical protein
VDAVAPVHSEQGALAASIRRLQDSLSTEVPFAWRILIGDNASTDETPCVTAALNDVATGTQLAWGPRESRAVQRAS